MDALRKYIFSVFAEPSDESSIVRTIRFLAEEGFVDDATLLAHHLSPQPFELLYSTDLNFDLQYWKSKFKISVNKPGFLEEIQLEKNNLVYLLGRDLRKESGYLLLTSSKLSEKTRKILQTWQILQEWNLHTRDRAEREVADTYANYISQIIHDSQSLIHLCQDYKSDRDTQKRLDYQEASNQNILLFIREPDLFMIPVRAEHFISDSLDLIGIKSGDLNLEIPENLPEITIDLELMSRALNEVVKNAMLASEGKLSGVTIRLNFFEPETPLHDFLWLIMEIEDKGCGILDDFISQTGRPFFTTRKHEGATGFGLTLARKIVESHHGSLEIHSTEGQGTRVTMYIPQDRQ